MKIARFWTTVNGGWVKLTMHAGDTVEVYEGGPHEEGYSHTWTSYEFDGQTVTRMSTTNSRDCDGQTSDRCDCECPVSKLASRAPYNNIDPEYCPVPGAMMPQWERVRSGQRDYAAESMGY